jgi:4-amino-4-deoxy-L-arabinose transferase-like glycosyltransferase
MSSQQRSWPSMSESAWVRRLALVAIAALAGLSYAWAIGHGGLEEYYYAAAVRSMSMSWHDFIFGAFDPAGTITLDKLPGAFWLQALSVRAFGMHNWAIILPQIIEGILTVLVLYRAVRRLAGPAAGLVAALVLAVSPATVGLDRGNISDSLLILLLVLAADAVSAAIAAETGKLGWLILAGVWVGLAFQAKEIEAWMVLPALGLAYLLAGPGSALRRTAQLAVAGVVVALVSLSWMTAVALVPAADRPYVDGSHDNSVYSQVFTYNGFSRFGGETPLQLAAAEVDPGAVLPVPARTPGRLLSGRLGRDDGWLIPAAAVVAIWGIVSRRRQPRGDPLRACFILWGSVLLTFLVVFSVVTYVQPYYVAALSPPVAAILGTGVAAAWSRERATVSLTIGLAVIVAGSAAYAAWLVHSAARAPGWLLPAIIAVGVAAIAVIAWSATGRLPAPSRVGPFGVALAAALVAVALAPAVASVSMAVSSESAFDTPFESAKVQEAIGLGAGQRAVANLATDLAFWQDSANGTPYLMAAQGVYLPVLIIYDTGQEAVPIGGLDGTTPSPTVAQLQADIRHGLLHLVWLLAPTDPPLRWTAAHCTQVTKRLYNCSVAVLG